MFAVALLTVLTVGIAAAVRVELLSSRSGLDRLRALCAAQAGISEAKAILVYDGQALDALTDDWGPQADEPLDLPVDIGDETYRVRVYDACGRIDINQADFVTLAHLTGSEAAAAAIIDWRDENNEPVTPEGAEADYYESLPYPYEPRNSPFETVGELLLVKGITPEMYFGTKDRPGLADLVTVESVSMDTDPAGDPRIEANELLAMMGGFLSPDQLAAQLGKWSGVITQDVVTALLNWRGNVSGAGYTAVSQIVRALKEYQVDYLPLLDPLTARPVDQVGGGPFMPPNWPPTTPAVFGKVNVNTAPSEVLAALPGSSPDVAKAFVDRRQNAPFTSLREVAELMLEQPNGENGVLLNMIDHVTTKSSTFMIESMGQTGRSFRTLRALVTRSKDDVQLVRQIEEDWPLPPPQERSARIARR